MFIQIFIQNPILPLLVVVLIAYIYTLIMSVRPRFYRNADVIFLPERAYRYSRVKVDNFCHG